MQEDVLEMEELELDGNFDQPLALGAPGPSGPSGPPGPPGPSGITPHIGSNGNWFIGEKDTGISAGGSGGYVAQDAPPEDTSVLWIDTDDNSDDGFQEAVNYALAQAKASGEFDGRDGYTPLKGKDYFDGKDGYTPVKGKDYFDGDDYVLTDSDRNEIAELAAGLVEVPDAQNPLIGTTAEVTPTEVALAITSGRPVIISAEDGENGAAFNNFHMVGNLDSATVVSTIIVPITQQGKTFHITITLAGSIPGNKWNLIQEDITEGGGISVTGATVGQTVKISAVDENGVPTAWEPADFPSGGGSGGVSDRLETIVDITTDKNVGSMTISEDTNGKPFSLKKMRVELNATAINGTIAPGGGDEIMFNGHHRGSFIVNSNVPNTNGSLTYFPGKPTTVTTETFKEYLLAMWELEVLDNGLILGKGRTATSFEDADGVLHATNGGYSGWESNRENSFISKGFIAKDGLNKVQFNFMWNSLPAGSHIVIKGIRM